MKTAAVTVALLAIPRLALACPVCFGNANSAQTKAAQAGILALLVVTIAMLASIAAFFFIYLRRRIRMVEESNGGELLDA
jgi:predicted transporter